MTRVRPKSRTGRLAVGERGGGGGEREVEGQGTGLFTCLCMLAIRNKERKFDAD